MARRTLKQIVDLATVQRFNPAKVPGLKQFIGSPNSRRTIEFEIKASILCNFVDLKVNMSDYSWC